MRAAPSDDRLRIALVHPVFWPEVHRGSERIVHGIATVMARRGHDVTLVTSHPRPTTESHEYGFRVIRARRPPRPPGLGLHELFVETAPGAARRLLGGRFDVAHAFFSASGFAAVKARRLGGPPVAFSFHGIPTRRYLVARRYRLEILRAVLAGAGSTTVLSQAAARPLERFLQVSPEVLPSGLFVADFRPAQRDPAPTLLCAASFSDPRKRVPLLLDAFTDLRQRRPEVRLVLADNPDPGGEAVRPSLPEGAEWADLNAPGALQRAYASSWATVLPAVEEAQGMVLLESLAAGTPVVAARSGACPEIVTSEAIGRLFEPDDRDDLGAALGAALGLVAVEGTAEACRGRAEAYDWARLATAHEQLYERLLRR